MLKAFCLVGASGFEPLTPRLLEARKLPDTVADLAVLHMQDCPRRRLVGRCCGQNRRQRPVKLPAMHRSAYQARCLLIGAIGAITLRVV
jgi:hypothetical protein